MSLKGARPRRGRPSAHLLTIGEPHSDGTRTVFCELNGQPREVSIRDRKLQVTEQAKPRLRPDSSTVTHAARDA